MSFVFIDPGPLVDHELELVAPEAKWIDEVLRTCAMPAGRRDPTARTTRQQLQEFLRAAPAGRYLPPAGEGRVPQYNFWMRLRPESQPAVTIAGTIGLRIGDNEDLRRYLGHIGYNVYPAMRGHHFAERASRLLMPFARRHGLQTLWITCNPDNLASRRTCERLGATFVDVIPVPVEHLLYQRGDREKCRYRIDL